MVKTRRGRLVAMLIGSALMVGGSTLMTAAPASAAQESQMKTGYGYGSYYPDLIYGYQCGANKECLFLYVEGSEYGPFSGDYEEELTLVFNTNTGAVTAHGQGTFDGTIQGCGQVSENYTISGPFGEYPKPGQGAEISGNRPVLNGQSLDFTSYESFDYEVAWLPCTNHA